MTPQLEKWLIRIFGYLFIILLVLSPKYCNYQGETKAQELCSSILIGEPVQSLLEKCEQQNAKCASGLPDNEITKHQAWFTGFLMNSYLCEVLTKNDKVIHKGYEAFTW